MNPTNTIIAFDLHSVVFAPDWKKSIKILWQWPHKLRLIGCALNIRFVWQCFALLTKDPTDEEYFALFQQRCPRLLPLIIDLFNAFNPIDGTVAILRELKEKRYPLHIASNCGPRRFQKLKERFPFIMDLFDKAKINNCDVNNLIKKPSPQFFEEYLRDYNPDNKKIVFIDNNKHNIKSAATLGIIGILFKSPTQLRDALKQIDIL